MSKRVKGTIALVAGAGQGIGRAVAERLAAEGAEVHAADINPGTLATLIALVGVSRHLARDADTGRLWLPSAPIVGGLAAIASLALVLSACAAAPPSPVHPPFLEPPQILEIRGPRGPHLAEAGVFADSGVNAAWSAGGVSAQLRRGWLG